MAVVRRIFRRPPVPPPPDPAHEAFLSRMEEGRALGARATRDASNRIGALQRDAGLDNDTINRAAFGRPRRAQRKQGPR